MPPGPHRTSAARRGGVSDSGDDIRGSVPSAHDPDVARQRQGYGHAAIDAVITYVRGRPNGRILYTSCAPSASPEDISPYPYYLAYGFTDTGRVMWGENVLAYALDGDT